MSLLNKTLALAIILIGIASLALSAPVKMVQESYYSGFIPSEVFNATVRDPDHKIYVDPNPNIFSGFTSIHTATVYA